MPEPDRSDDYVWHFKLREDDAQEPGSGDALTEMVRAQIAALLRCVQLTSEGRDLKVTGFRFLDAAAEHPVKAPRADAGSLGLSE